MGRGLTKTGDDYSRHDPRRRSQHARRPASTRSSRSRPTSRARGEGRAHAPRSGEPLELGAELAGEVVVRVVIVPVLLPLVDVLGVFFLRAPLCARGDERMRSGSGPVAARRGRDARFPGEGAFRARSRGRGGVKGVGTRRRAPSLPNSSNSSSHSRSTATFFLGSSFCSVHRVSRSATRLWRATTPRARSGSRRPVPNHGDAAGGGSSSRNSSQTEPLEKRSLAHPSRTTTTVGAPSPPPPPAHDATRVEAAARRARRSGPRETREGRHRPARRPSTVGPLGAFPGAPASSGPSARSWGGARGPRCAARDEALGRGRGGRGVEGRARSPHAVRGGAARDHRRPGPDRREGPGEAPRARVGAVGRLQALIRSPPGPSSSSSDADAVAKHRHIEARSELLSLIAEHAAEELEEEGSARRSKAAAPGGGRRRARRDRPRPRGSRSRRRRRGARPSATPRRRGRSDRQPSRR